MARKRAVGNGSVYRRRDGRWEASLTCVTTAGIRKRIRRYAASQAEADEKLSELKAQARQGIPVPDRNWKVGDYLEYWYQASVIRTRRPTTQEQYEGIIRLYLRPGLGGYTLASLSVPALQAFLDGQIAKGCSARQVQKIRTVLSAALANAMREELLTRNVAHLVQVPTSEPRHVPPWTTDEARAFLAATRTHTMYPAFLLLVYYGLRRGEVLGLRWSDIDVESGNLHVRQQLVRAHQQLQLGPVKTAAGKRDLPLLNAVHEALAFHRERQARLRQEAGDAWRSTDPVAELVFTTSSGLPIEPRNFDRTFKNVCAKESIRIIRVHDTRHTAATLLKDLGVPDKDIQLILGHASPLVTRQIYEHGTVEKHRADLTRLADSLSLSMAASVSSRQTLPSSLSFIVDKTSSNFGSREEIRTPDPRLMRATQPSVHERLAEVKRAVNNYRRSWLCGVVAVNSCRQIPWSPTLTHVYRALAELAIGVRDPQHATSLRQPSHGQKAEI